MNNRWHMWYAWYPIIARTETQTLLIICEDVMRRRIYKDGRFRWEYQPIESSAEH